MVCICLLRLKACVSKCQVLQRVHELLLKILRFHIYAIWDIMYVEREFD